MCNKIDKQYSIKTLKTLKSNNLLKTNSLQPNISNNAKESFAESAFVDVEERDDEIDSDVELENDCA